MFVSSCRAAVLLFVVAALAGCALLRYKTAEPPQVTVTGIELAGFSIFEQKFNVGLRLQNPNDFALPITGMRYKLFVEGNAVASGVSDASVTVPAYSEKQFTVSVVGNFLSTVSQLQRWRQTPGSALKYRLKGSLKMADVPVKVPFDYAGSLQLRQEEAKPAQAR